MQESLETQTDAPQREPIRWSAILGLVLAAFSFLALLGPTWWFLPVFAIACCGAALWGLDEERQGRRHRLVPLLGLSVALFVAGLAPTTHYSRSRHLENLCKKYGREWIEMVMRKQLREAHQLSLPMNGRATDYDSMLELYRTAQRIDQNFMSFEQHPVVRHLVRLGETAAIQYEGVSDALSNDEYDSVVLHYSIVGMADGAERSVPLSLILRRMRPVAGRSSHWEVASFEIREEP
jgi:hypothetical protein